MTASPQTTFTTLSASEKKSKLRQLVAQSGSCTLWLKGQRERSSFKVKDLNLETLQISFHPEAMLLAGKTELLGSFELSGVDFFFKARVISQTKDALVLDAGGEFYKSERRQNFRLLAYPIYDITVRFRLPEAYVGGKVVDIKNRSSQTGLFKSFLKLVDPAADDGLGESLRFRVQDLSVTGLSFFVGEVELPFFKTGELFQGLELSIQGDPVELTKARIVYVVDQIGFGDKGAKKFKVGVHFEDLPLETDQQLGRKINELLRQIDANADFEDFVK